MRRAHELVARTLPRRGEDIGAARLDMHLFQSLPKTQVLRKIENGFDSRNQRDEISLMALSSQNRPL